MSSFTTKHDEQLQTLVHYQNYPEMLPFIGTNYDSQEKKLLIIGESHYLPKDTLVDVMKWYEMDSSMLSDDDRDYIWTRNVEWLHDKEKSPFKPIARAISETGFNPTHEFNVLEIFKHLAWCNFFQRPAEKTGESINPRQLDREKSEEVLVHIFETIQPTHVVFVSSKAWDWSEILRDKCKDEPIIFDYAPHPNTRWWNRTAEKYGNMTGKEKFQNFLKKHKILVP